jgi:hypothetical protein
MPTSYTSLLGLALPVTGELSGTWGDTVNDYITKYIDASVAGAQTISGSQTAVTLSTTNGSTLSQAGAGATGSAQYQIINCTGNPASLLTITAPATSKSYIIINGTSTSQSVKIVGAGPTTGVTVAAGDKALVAWNGSDFVRIGASAGGSNTQVQYNSGGNLAGSANLTFDGSNLQVGSQGDLRFGDSDNSNWVAFQGPATVASNVTWTLPSTDGTNGQALITNGSGTLSWSTNAVTISNDTSTATNVYPTFVSATTGTASTIFTSNAKLLYKPSTGEFQSEVPVAGNGIFVNNTTVATSYTIAAGYNGQSVGPITVNSGVTVTVSSGQRWLVV